MFKTAIEYFTRVDDKDVKCKSCHTVKYCLKEFHGLHPNIYFSGLFRFDQY